MRPAQVSRVARTALKLQQRTVAAAATASAPAAGSLLIQTLSGAQVRLFARGLSGAPRPAGGGRADQTCRAAQPAPQPDLGGKALAVWREGAGSKRPGSQLLPPALPHLFSTPPSPPNPQSPRARAAQAQVQTPQQAFEAHTAAHFYGSSRPGMDGLDDGEAAAALLREHLAAVFAAEAHTAAPGIPSAQLGAAGGPTDRNTARTAAAAVQARLVKSGARVAAKAT